MERMNRGHFFHFFVIFFCGVLGGEAIPRKAISGGSLGMYRGFGNLMSMKWDDGEGI
jgi:hypothetical protein